MTKESGTLLCEACARWAFSVWRGWCSSGTESWAEKPDLPAVSMVEAGPCPRCSGTTTVSLSQVYYRNIHGPHSTGLPDYFELVIQDNDPFNMRRWGRPFLDKWISARIPLDELVARMKHSRYR